MNEMIYGNKNSEILDFGTYKGKDYVIVNLAGYHPCAYVQSDFNYYEGEYYSPAHCGFTFYDKLTLWNRYDSKNYDEKFFNRYFVGWDYGHYCDYDPILEPQGKKWTTNEIFENVKEVIDWMINEENE